MEEMSESSTEDEGDFWRSQGHGASHRYTLSTSSVGTSVLFDREDAETDDLEYELPTLGTARLQSHRSMPVGRLVYLSKSPTRAATGHDNAGAGMHSSRRSDWSRTLSALFDYTWDEHCHELVANAPLRRQTVHACQTSISELPWFIPGNGYPAQSLPQMLSTQERHECRPLLGAHPDACNDSQATSQRPQSPVVDARRNRLTQALRSHPPVPKRASSLPSHKVLAKGGLEGDDETVMGSDDELASDDGFRFGGSPSISPVLVKPSQLPATPQETAVTYGTATPTLQHGDYSPSRARSLSLFPNSPAQTLVDDTVPVVHDLKTCNSLKDGGREGDTAMLVSRLRKLWQRCCRRNRC